MAYVIERASRSGTWYVGIYRAANGKYKSAGTYDSHERAYEVAEEERHARGFLDETSPAGKATMTISEFCEQRFLRYHALSPGTRQEYGYLAKNHIVPYIGHLRISEANRETFFNLLVNALPAEEAPQITIRATRKVLSAMCQMAFDEGYRDNNPIRSIRLKHAPAKSVLVASHDQWRRLEEAMTYPPARLYARLNVTTWARRCEMIGFRPCDFDFGQQMLNVTRSTVYVNAKYHPSGKAGWFTKPNPKNGDWRRFAISKQMCQAVQEMRAKIFFITLAVDDLDRSVGFYRDGLGWPTEGIVGQEFHDEVTGADGTIAIFTLDGGLLLTLYERTNLAKDASLPAGPPSSTEFSLGIPAQSQAEVDRLLVQVEAAGGTLTAPAHMRPFGVYSGYFTDPDGHLFEIAWNSNE